MLLATERQVTLVQWDELFDRTTAFDVDEADVSATLDRLRGEAEGDDDDPA